MPRGIEEMHRSALAPRDSGKLAEELGHEGLGIEPAGQGMAMVPVCREHVILRKIEGGNRADRYGFLTCIEMAETAYLPQSVHLAGLLLECPYKLHFLQQGEQFLF